MTDETPIFRELLEDAARNRKLAQSVCDAVYRDHYELHDGPILFCPTEACRLVSGRSAA